MKIPFSEYLDLPAMSSSYIKLLLKSPLHAKNGYGGISFDSDKKGTAFHSMVLEGRNEIIAPLDCPRKSKADRAAWAEWYSSNGGNVDTSKPAATWNEVFYKQTGIYVGTADEVELIRSMASSTLSVCPDIGFSDYDEDGFVEWTETFVDLGHEFKVRYDKINTFDHVIYDLKSCADASPKGFAAACRRYRYDIQAQLYSCAYYHNHGIWPVFKFIAVEKSAPHYAAVYTLDDYSMEKAAEDISTAIEIHESCTKSGVWPGYQEQELSLYGGGQVAAVDDLDELLA